MADFQKAFEEIILHKDGFIYDKYGRSSDSFLGIKKSDYKDDLMWRIINDIKFRYGIENVDKYARTDRAIMQCVKNIYRLKYWTLLKLDYINSQKLATQIFNEAVNYGSSAARRYVKELVGVDASHTIGIKYIKALNEYAKQMGI